MCRIWIILITFFNYDHIQCLFKNMNPSRLQRKWKYLKIYRFVFPHALLFNNAGLMTKEVSSRLLCIDFKKCSLKVKKKSLWIGKGLDVFSLYSFVPMDLPFWEISYHFLLTLLTRTIKVSSLASSAAFKTFLHMWLQSGVVKNEAWVNAV